MIINCFNIISWYLDRIAGSAIARAALRCLVFFGLIDTISSWYIGQKSHFSNICNFQGSETSRSINEPKGKKNRNLNCRNCMYVLLTTCLHEKRITISTKVSINKRTTLVIGWKKLVTIWNSPLAKKCSEYIKNDRECFRPLSTRWIFWGNLSLNENKDTEISKQKTKEKEY